MVSLAIPADTAVGMYFVIAKADADGVDAEASEFNNTLGRVVNIGPDPVASSLTAPLAAGSGAVIAVSETVKNQGGGVSAASTTRFYLSNNAALDAADVMLTGGRAVPGLAAGATSNGSTQLTIPAATATGTYYLFAKADGDAAVLETQETNNTTLRSIQIGGDLAVTAMTVPLKAGAGTSNRRGRHHRESGRRRRRDLDHALLPVGEPAAGCVGSAPDRRARRARARRERRQCRLDNGGDSAGHRDGRLLRDREGRRRRPRRRDAGRE